MQALLLDQPGDYWALCLTEAPLPAPNADEIRVKVHAVGLNPVDFKLALSGFSGWQYPFGFAGHQQACAF